MHGSPSSRSRYAEFRAKRRANVHMDERGDQAAASRGERRTKRRRYMRQYARWLRPFFGALAAIFTLAVFAALVNMVKPILTQQIIDRAVLADDLTMSQKLWRLNIMGGSMIAVILVVQLLDSWRNFRLVVMNLSIVHRLRQQLFDHMLKLPLSRLQATKQGGISSRLSGDIDSVTRMLNLVIISPGVAIVQVMVAMGIIFYWNWRLALAATLCVPPLMLLHLWWVRRIRPIYRSMRKDREQIEGRVVESFGGIRVVRAFRREAHERHDYATGHHTVVRKLVLARGLQTLVGAGWGVMMPTISIVIVWYGGYLVMRDTAMGVTNGTTIGQIFAFQWYAFFLLGPVLRIVESMSDTQQSLAALERVFDLLAEPVDKPDADDAIDAPRQVQSLHFDRMTFAYETDRPVINDFDLNVPGGSVVALVGPSGAGKTTITDLVARFQDPTDGAILLNGIDLRRFKLESYRQLLGIVQQDVFLFDGTVGDNIAYGRRDAAADDIADAARRANAHDFIADLPDGYDTLIGERGIKLSGGQRQRLSIARAFLADPQILILDEATSNLDTESEQLIQSAMSDLLRGRTTFVIAHRLSTITGADMIIVMESGRIVEQGTHEQLMRHGGLYTQMVQRQREAYDIAMYDVP